VVSTQPVPDDSAVAQPMTASSLASSAPQNGPGTRRHATSRARHHSAYINACRAVCVYAPVWHDLTRLPQVAPPSRSKMALFSKSVSLRSPAVVLGIVQVIGAIAPSRFLGASPKEIGLEFAFFPLELFDFLLQLGVAE
jgi:hypothetical protein